MHRVGMGCISWRKGREEPICLENSQSVLEDFKLNIKEGEIQFPTTEDQGWELTGKFTWGKHGGTGEGSGEGQQVAETVPEALTYTCQHEEP